MFALRFHGKILEDRTYSLYSLSGAALALETIGAQWPEIVKLEKCFSWRFSFKE